MRLEKRFLLAAIAIAGFVFTVSFSTLYAQTHIIEGTACTCTLPIPLLIPMLSSLGVLVGSITYYLLFPKIEKSEQKTQACKLIFLDLLTGLERDILREIIINQGKVYQSVLSRKFGKVRVHRTLTSLESRGIIQKTRAGKTSIVELTQKFKEALL